MSGKFEITKTQNGKIVFNLKASNGQVILTSQMYENKDVAFNGIDSVKKNATTDAQYERKTAQNGESFFVLKATNGQIIGKSETYKSTAALENGIASVKSNAPSSEIADLVTV